MIRSRYYAFLPFYLNIIVVHSYILGYSDSVEQCGSVKVTWRGQQTDAAEQFQFPFYLYIVPFNSTAAIRTIDNWNPSTTLGSALFDFPPFTASTPYILGVVDSSGKGVGSSSQLHTVQNSTNTSCLTSSSLSSSSSPPPHIATFATVTAGPSYECPSVSLEFPPTTSTQVPRALIFSPGERPSNMLHSSNNVRQGFVRDSGFTSLSRAVVVFQSNDSAPALTSSLMTVGGSDSTNCVQNDVLTVPTALKGGTVIGYTLAAVFTTALVTALLVYIHHLRRRASWTTKGPCVPEKDLQFIIHRRSRFLSLGQDRDLEAARLVPLPPSTASLVMSDYTSPEPLRPGRRSDSPVSAVVPNPPRSTPVTPTAVPNVLHSEETPIRPTTRHQSIEPRPAPRMTTTSTARASSMCNHTYTHTRTHTHDESQNQTDISPSDYSIITRTRRPSYASYEVNSARPSTFITGESVMLNEESFVTTTSTYIPRPDSPTLPDIPTGSPFNLSLRLERLSRGSSKKSVIEKRSLYLKMDDPDSGPDPDGRGRVVVVDGGGGAEKEARNRASSLSAQSSSGPRSRSLGRTKSNSSRKSKKRRPSLPDAVLLNVA